MNLKGVKRNKIIYAVIFCFIAYAGYASFQAAKKSWDAKKLAEEKIIQTLPGLCEAGKWIEISKVKSPGDEYEGQVVLKKKGNDFSDADEKIYFTALDKDRLVYFANREIKVEGIQTGEMEVAVSRIKCAGAEADPKALAERRKLINYIALSINTLAPEQSRNGAWKVVGFYFVNETDLYVEYGIVIPESKEIKKEIVSERHLWLIRATKPERSRPVIEELAYLENNNEEDIPGGTVLRGENIYQDAKITLVYKLDKVTNQWKLK